MYTSLLVNKLMFDSMLALSLIHILGYKGDSCTLAWVESHLQ